MNRPIYTGAVSLCTGTHFQFDEQRAALFSGRTLSIGDGFNSKSVFL